MATRIEETLLFTAFSQRVNELAAAPAGLLASFDALRQRLEAEGKYIVTIFPEYTPHDWVDHISNLFSLADRLLGASVYEKLRPAELALFVFGLVSHDWGMVVSDSELAIIKGNSPPNSTCTLLPGEPESAIRKVEMMEGPGVTNDVAWREYLRETSGLRSGARLRQFLRPISAVFAEAVAKIAEGHTLHTHEIRNSNLYPNSMSIFGETVNLAALATYVRIVDLLDIGEDRTPYILWSFVAPKDKISKMHWDRHRALSPVSVKQGDAFRSVVISGNASDADTYAAIADLQFWIDSQFEQSINTLRTIPGNYDIDLDSRISWIIHAVGFEPMKIRFELDHSRILQLLSSELYEKDSLAYLRELLQNSVDAIDTREAILLKEGASLKGKIDVKIQTDTDGLFIEWRDNGIGMDEKILRSFFCKIGYSWYQSKEAQKLTGLDAISQFGIGVLSCFSVSDEIHVETRRDPNMTESREGLLIDIPSRDSYFRVKKSSNIPVGTCIRIKLRESNNLEILKNKIRNSIIRISRFVQHEINISIDGVTSNTRLPIKVNNSSIDDFFSTLKVETADSITKHTQLIEIKVGDPTLDYNGIYQGLFPIKPSEARGSTTYSTWELSKESIDIDHIIAQSEQSIFLKGVQAGRVETRKFGRQFHDEINYNLIGNTSWIRPTLLLNLKKPSFVEVNLSRSQIQFKSNSFILKIHSDIARELAMRVFGGLTDDPENNAFVLGALACFGGISIEALTSLISQDDIPILVLGEKNGFHWKKLGDFKNANDILEAPFELIYAWGNQRGQDPLVSSKKFKWSGQDAIITKLNSKFHPWLNYSLELARKTLDTLGWHPTAMKLVTAPSNENTPLICRVWTCNSDMHAGGIKKIEQQDVFLEKSMTPELLPFPDEIREYAAFGSRYWNSSHKKIQAITNALRELRKQYEKGGFSDDDYLRYQYLMSNKYYGFIVPSRSSGNTLAISLTNNLLDLANKIGINIDRRLEPNDFYPGTVGEYKNPYHYNLKYWEESKISFGLDVK